MLHTLQPTVADNPSSLSLVRIRAEYQEMPGLALTLPQAARLWGVNSVAVEPLLRTLVDSGFLWKTDAGQYIRRSDSPDAAPRLPPGVRRVGSRP
jgi:hypothetical protein